MQLALCKKIATCLCVTLVTLAYTHTQADASDAFTPWHVAKVRMVSDAAISPDGNYIAYVLRVPRTPMKDASGGSWGELHVVYPSGESRPFITGEVNIGGIAWTPDGRYISFVASRGGEANRSLYRIPIDGGEAQKVLSFSSSIGQYSWSPDGTQVAFIASDPRPDEAKNLVEKGFNQEIYEENFRPLRVRIGTIGPNAPEPRTLEIDGYPSDVQWAPTGTHLAMALAPTPLVDDSYMKRKVRVVDSNSGKILARFDNPGKLGSIAWSPDAKHLAFIAGEDKHDPSAGRLVVAPLKGGKMRWLPIGADGEFSDIVWKDNETITYLASVGVWTRMGDVSLDGKLHDVRVPEGSMVLSDLSLSKDGQKLAMLSENPRQPSEVYAMSEGNERPHRMTQNNSWFSDMRFAQQEVVTYKARDGLEIEGILVRPLDEKKGKRYPLILTVHGGPEAHISNGWVTTYGRPGQTGAAQGFAVFYPNYRGSTGRGVEFSKMGQSDYAGKEFDDLVDAVQHLVNIGLVEKKRVGITGGSYGGFASAWGATYLTEHFAASVMFVGISNQISKSGTTDIPNEMFLVHARKSLYENWQWFLERSPIYHVKKARTPLLILHGKEDTRVHPSQSMEIYRHFKVLGKAPVRLVFYPGEGHGNRKSAARLDYNLRMLRWFEHYLKGKGGEPPPHEVDYASPEDKEAEKAEKKGEAKQGQKTARKL